MSKQTRSKSKTTHNKTVKSAKHKKEEKKERSVYTKKHYNSNDGMLTTVWGPSMWHFLHTMSFNYPVKPSDTDKRSYRIFIQRLQYILPCGKCRKNLKKNFAKLPLLEKHMDSRHTFSKYIYDLHEVVNKMLHKKSGLSYNDVRNRYEHFRARCVLPLDKSKEVVQEEKHATTAAASDPKKEDGCTEPIYGEKSKCVLQILPQTAKCETFQMDEKCIKRKIENNIEK